MSVPSPSPKGQMPLKNVAIIATIVSFAVGGLGAGVCYFLDVPAYFGFFFGFTLAGLCGMFALANHIGQSQEK